MLSHKPSIEIQGHRGFKGLYPENSILAFEKAAEFGVDVLEMDICVSEDLKIVVSHEPYINPSICKMPDNGHNKDDLTLEYNLYKMSYDEISAFDCGSVYQEGFPLQKKIKASKPLLKEVFKRISPNYPEMRFNIEIKAHPQMDRIFTPEPKEYVNLVLEVIDSEGMQDQINLQSFDLRILEEIHRQNPTIELSLLVDSNESISEKLDALSFKPEIISPHFSLLNTTNVDKYQSDGFLIVPWTVNSFGDLQHMIDLGVNGIITDYPNRLKSLLVK
ncbi:MAG: glycerophosphodiester phosphodiesterase [Flavobacteriaceae bacterium]|nr:glycerophosphodiester phosphodiesterase [Flavobacteriaceae bacterium]NNL80414.1 glycerophosphodiester phosphodiesterase [Flavobacteriaceae bacterium]